MIPCYVTMRDLVTWPRRLCTELERLGFRPVLRDHGSTYPPLLKWYEQCPYELGRLANEGCYGFWHRGEHRAQTTWYAVTDCDLDLSVVPDDFINVAQQAFEANSEVIKVGVSLEINDVPPESASWKCIQKYEPRYWTQRTADGHWFAGIGATLALYHPSRPYEWGRQFYQAVRLDRPYTARHLPWYLTPASLGEEYSYYLERIDRLPVFSNWIKRHV